jgi:hypothetical protein
VTQWYPDSYTCTIQSTRAAFSLPDIADSTNRNYTRDYATDTMDLFFGLILHEMMQGFLSHPRQE